jgi:hypothetical protein
MPTKTPKSKAHSPRSTANSNSTPTPTKRAKRATRSRGAQPGNTNALQHGFYSERVADTGSDTITADADLSGEIKTLRRVINRVATLIEQNSITADDGPLNLDRIMSLLNTLGAAQIRVASLLKSQKILAGKSGNLETLLQQAISDVLEENNAPT